MLQRINKAQGISGMICLVVCILLRIFFLGNGEVLIGEALTTRYIVLAGLTMVTLAVIAVSVKKKKSWITFLVFVIPSGILAIW